MGFLMLGLDTSTRPPKRRLLRVYRLVASGLLATGVACAGEGEEPPPFAASQQSVVFGTCANCHDGAGIRTLVEQVRALDRSVFTDARFRPEWFPNDIRNKTTTEIIQDGMQPRGTPRDADIPPDAPDAMARILHELHELWAQLETAVPSDFTTQELFDAYNQNENFLYGCDTVERLELRVAGAAQPMPPDWTAPLFESLGLPFVPLAEADRQAVIDYVRATIPGGYESSCL